VALVAVCVLAGARLLARADDTVAVWAAGHDAAAGAVLQPGDLVAERVRFADAGAQAAYLTGAAPGQVVLTHALAAGELVPRAALASGAGDLARLPLALDPAALPSSVGPGSSVDVYATGQGASGPLLSGVGVVEVVTGGALDGSTEVTLAVPPAAVTAYFQRLAHLDSPRLTLVGRS